MNRAREGGRLATDYIAPGFSLSARRVRFTVKLIEIKVQIMPEQSKIEELSLPTAETGVMTSPFCRELRSKRHYFLQEMPTEEHHLLDSSNRCWCRLTMQVVGPDGQQAQPKDCTAGRSCYRSLFE